MLRFTRFPTCLKGLLIRHCFPQGQPKLSTVTASQISSSNWDWKCKNNSITSLSSPPLIFIRKNLVTSSCEKSPATTFSKSRDKSDYNEEGIPPGGWFLLVIPVSTLMLGVWQVFRWRWKLGLIREMHEKTSADPVPLPMNLQDIEELEYQKVKVRGEFDYTKEILMGPRTLMKIEDKDGEKGRGVFSSAGQSHGYHIITPFKVEGSDEVLLINRGWISTRNPQKYKHLTGPIDIVGIVRKNEPRAPFMTKNKPGQTLMHYRDVPTMSAMLGADEVFLDLHSIDGVNFSNAHLESIPVPRQTRVTLRNEHVSYFVTWFSLSLITGFMWHRRFIRRLDLL